MFMPKSATNIEEQEMKDFLMPKIDAAVDIVDEAMLILEELGLTEKDEARKLDLRTCLIS